MGTPWIDESRKYSGLGFSIETLSTESVVILIYIVIVCFILIISLLIIICCGCLNMGDDIEDRAYDTRTSQDGSGNKRRFLKYAKNTRLVTTIKLPQTTSIMTNRRGMNDISVWDWIAKLWFQTFIFALNAYDTFLEFSLFNQKPKRMKQHNPLIIVLISLNDQKSVGAKTYNWM